MVVFVALRRTRASGLNEGLTLLCLLALKPIELAARGTGFRSAKTATLPKVRLWRQCADVLVHDHVKSDELSLSSFDPRVRPMD